ncbi:MAG: hypothetical protein GWP64_04370 [Gammaproteobacteria bacterium]|nr:hypothetical protein [Gammaproteobacteria bacterium]
MLHKKPRIAWLVGLLLAALLTGVIYAPGLSGSLYLDSAKLYQVEQVYREKGADVELKDLAFAREFGRVIPQLTFYLNTAIDDGVNPYAIKLTNVVIHAFNAMLVYLFSSLLLDRTRYRERRHLLAAAAALAWLISAVNVSGVLYAVQRMNQLATLFSLAALVFYLKLRGAQSLRLWSGSRLLALVGGVVALAIVAYACKENALLIPVFIVLIEWYLFPDLPAWLRTRAGLAAMIAATALLVVLLAWLLPGSGLIDYSARTFTLEERVLTEARILWIYMAQLILPSSTATGLYQDGIPVSSGLFSPLSTAAAVAGITGLIVCAIRYRGHEAVGIIAFGIAFFLAGHLLESTVFPLELYYEHRNYLPSAGLYLSFAVSASWLLRDIRRPYAIGIALVYFAGVAYVAHAKAVTWSDQGQAFRLAMQRDYLSPRAASGIAQIHLEEGRTGAAMELLDRVIAESPHQALRARLQKLYVQCAIGASPDKHLYAELPKVTGRELDIEVSQALSNVTTLYVSTGCGAIDVDRLIPILASISENLRADQRSSWHIDYYVGQLYSTYDNQQAAEWLEARFLGGEESAGWVLVELLERDPSIRVAPDTVAALDILRSRGQ